MGRFWCDGNGPPHIHISVREGEGFVPGRGKESDREALGLGSVVTPTTLIPQVRYLSCGGAVT